MATITYANQGAVRNLPVTDELRLVLEVAAQQAGVDEVRVISGGQPAAGEGERTGSTRHDHGNAADIELIVNGRTLDMTNPADQRIMQEFARISVANGATGIGAAPDYMGVNRMHIGFQGQETYEGPWGAGGRSANTPGWLQSAWDAGRSGAPIPPVPVGNNQPQQQGQIATAGAFMGFNPQSLGTGLLQRGIGVGQQGGDPRVEALQRFLNTQGANLTVDGDFGRATEAAVRQFQERSGLNPDGIVGDRTRQAIQGAAQPAFALDSPPTPKPSFFPTLAAFREARQQGASIRDAWQQATRQNAPQQQPSAPMPNPNPQRGQLGTGPTPRPNPVRLPLTAPPTPKPQSVNRSLPYDATRNANPLRNDPEANRGVEFGGPPPYLNAQPYSQPYDTPPLAHGGMGYGEHMAAHARPGSIDQRSSDYRLAELGPRPSNSNRPGGGFTQPAANANIFNALGSEGPPLLQNISGPATPAYDGLLDPQTFLMTGGATPLDLLGGPVPVPPKNISGPSTASAAPQTARSVEEMNTALGTWDQPPIIDTYEDAQIMLHGAPQPPIPEHALRLLQLQPQPAPQPVTTNPKRVDPRRFRGATA